VWWGMVGQSIHLSITGLVAKGNTNVVKKSMCFTLCLNAKVMTYTMRLTVSSESVKWYCNSWVHWCTPNVSIIFEHLIGILMRDGRVKRWASSFWSRTKFSSRIERRLTLTEYIDKFNVIDWKAVCCVWLGSYVLNGACHLQNRVNNNLDRQPPGSQFEGSSGSYGSASTMVSNHTLDYIPIFHWHLWYIYK
jgi:hypothetical protein